MASAKPLNFGIEEEYFLTDLTTRELVREPHPRFLPACHTALPELLRAELFASQLGVFTPIMSSLEEARECLTHARTTLAWLGEESGIGILAAGTHPLAQWRLQQPTDLPHYHELFEDLQMVAQRSVLSGLHVHVGTPGDRIAVMNRVLPWLPLLLALSASSPFWGGRVSGLHSYRQAAFDEWPRMGLPEHFEDQAGYERYVDALLASGSVRSRSDVWWNLRPSLSIPTLELRITDACPHMDDALCIAGLFRALVNWAVDAEKHNLRPAPGNELQRLLVKENRWRAKRYGTLGDYIEPGSQHSVSLATWLSTTWQLIGPYAQAAGEEWVYPHAQQIVADGNSASDQLHQYQANLQRGVPVRDALSAVVDRLRNQTLAV